MLDSCLDRESESKHARSVLKQGQHDHTHVGSSFPLSCMHACKSHYIFKDSILPLDSRAKELLAATDDQRLTRFVHAPVRIRTEVRC